MKKNTTPTLKQVLVLALAIFTFPVLAQEAKKEKKKIEKRIEVESENGKERVTITTIDGDKETVEVMEGAEANEWMEAHKAKEDAIDARAHADDVRVFVTEDNENGKVQKRVKVVSGSGSNEDVQVWVSDDGTQTKNH